MMFVRPTKKVCFMAALVVALIATAVISLGLSGIGKTAAAPPISPLLLGTNLNLKSANDQVLTSSATQDLLKQMKVGMIRIPTPSGISDDTLKKAAQVVKNLGASPVVILHG